MMMQADILIVATGNNDKSHAYTPELPHRHVFSGTVLHSSQVTDEALLKSAQNIVVVGGSKSAFDVANLYPEKTTLVMKTPHFFGPRWLLLSPFLDRLMFYMMHNYKFDKQERSWFYRCMDAVLGCFVFSVSCPPSNPSVMEDILHGGGFHVCSTHAQRQRIRKLNKVVTGDIPTAYTKEGLQLKNNDNNNDTVQVLKADVIVWGTGFHPAQAWNRLFPGVDLQDSLDDGLYLYQYMVHPKLPDCYFVGFHDPSFASCMTSSGEALWAVFSAGGKTRSCHRSQAEQLQQLQKRQSRFLIDVPNIGGNVAL